MKFTSHTSRSIAVALAMSLSVAACASARYHKLPFSGKPQVTDRVKLSVLEPEGASGTSVYSETTERQWLWDILERTASCAYQSMRFSPHETATDDMPDKIITISVKRSTERSALGYTVLFLGGFAIPSRLEKTSFAIETRFQNARGDELGTITEWEQLSTWGGLLLAFGMPFTRSFRDLAGDALYSAHHRTILQAIARGYLAGPPLMQHDERMPIPIEPSPPPG